MLRDCDGSCGIKSGKEIGPLVSDGRGVLLCCGELLAWERIDGTDILEVICGRCGAVYAMDPGVDSGVPQVAETPTSQRPERSVVKVV